MHCVGEVAPVTLPVLAFAEHEVQALALPPNENVSCLHVAQPP
jgi:hypothetical protein